MSRSKLAAISAGRDSPARWEPAAHSASNRTTTFGFDAHGNRTSTCPNGVTQPATFDAAARIGRIAGTDTAGAALTDFTYDYTDAGNDTALRPSVTDTNGNTTRYGYDACPVPQVSCSEQWRHPSQ